MLNKSFIQNLSICIGRLSLVDPKKISAYLDIVTRPFCLSMRNVNDSPEKRDAFK